MQTTIRGHIKMEGISIIDYIPHGRDNAITNRELQERLQITDRQVREYVEQARREGVIIINLQDGRGYFQTDDIEYIERQYNQNRSRAMSILVQQKPLRRKLREHGLNPEWTLRRAGAAQ